LIDNDDIVEAYDVATTTLVHSNGGGAIDHGQWRRLTHLKSDMSLLSYDSGKAAIVDAPRIGSNRAYQFSDDVTSDKAGSMDAPVMEKARLASRSGMSGRSTRSSKEIIKNAQVA